jgi:predicted DNA-binding transcriptional regulator AlpA
MMRPREVMLAMGYGAYSTLYREYKSGRFPQPIQIGRKSIGWRRSTVNAERERRQRPELNARASQDDESNAAHA